MGLGRWAGACPVRASEPRKDWGFALNAVGTAKRHNQRRDMIQSVSRIFLWLLEGNEWKKRGREQEQSGGPVSMPLQSSE